jgi:hypothetical protein
MWLAICVLSLRAFVPTGFMPSVEALRDGRFEMTICSGAGGMRTVLVDANGDLVKAPHGSEGQDDPSMHLEQCPFGALGSLMAMPSVAPMVIGAAMIVRSLLLARRDTALPALPAQGPPLGSRAPPLRLG